MPAAAASPESTPPPHRDERGYTLIELMIVLIMLGIVTLIALPSYLAFRVRANDVAAKSDLVSIANTITAFYGDNRTYVGMTLPGLKATYDQALDTSTYVLPAADLSATEYCVETTSGARTWRKFGPAARFENLSCP
jgi:prepilin-type N-terminal cleavage/methylation domain-containing protein